MRNAIYAVALKTNDGLKFIPRAERDLEALDAAEKELFSLALAGRKPISFRGRSIPKSPATRDRARTECRAGRTCSRRVSSWPWECWSELQTLRPEIVRQEGRELGEAVVHLLAFAADKFANYNSVLASWHAPRAVMRSVFDRHDIPSKPLSARWLLAAPESALTGRLTMWWILMNTSQPYREIRMQGRPLSR